MKGVLTGKRVRSWHGKATYRRQLISLQSLETWSKKDRGGVGGIDERIREPAIDKYVYNDLTPSAFPFLQHVDPLPFE